MFTEYKVYMTSSQNSASQASMHMRKVSHIPNFSHAKLLVVGDIMLDRYYLGATERISPEAPVPIVKIDECEDRAGGAANVAVNAAMLGANVTLMGFVGIDEGAKVLETALHGHNISCHFMPVAGYNTITKLRVLSRNQQLIRLDFEKSFAGVDKSDLLARYKAQLANINVVVLSDYAKGALSEVEALIEAANEAGIPVVVDPKSESFLRYKGAAVITPNMSEFEIAHGACVNEKQLHDNALACCISNNIQHLLLTRSEKGMSLFSMNNTQSEVRSLHLPAFAREVYDVTGAGDTVVSTLACTLGAGGSVELACQLANHAASVVVGKLGTSSVTTTEIALAINKHKSIDAGVLNQEQLIIAVQQAQAKGERVVMTNGCFDILHAGHVSYLSEAAGLGDRLIVAVNSDASVTTLKGEGRPVNNVNRRMAVLAGLASVDWVVEFSEETPQRLISEMLPNILVKGGDYKIEDIAGGKEVIANGGNVMTLGFEEGVSTTAIIKQIVSTGR
ncbi:MAG: D-beta-D-heptose 7-phosphate kinase/D-beta-D-heptose 1-phosphate adenosyltransferase [Alphaproteobacteria bacterium]